MGQTRYSGLSPIFQMSSHMVSAMLFPFERKHLPFESRFEIPVFIKDIIVGQAGLMGHAFDLLFVEQPGGIK
jgi:hypothetical protein